MIYGLVAPGYEMAEAVAKTMTGEDQAFTGADMSTKLKLMGVDVASFGRYSGFKVRLSVIMSPPPASYVDARTVWWNSSRDRQCFRPGSCWYKYSSSMVPFDAGRQGREGLNPFRNAVPCVGTKQSTYK